MKLLAGLFVPQPIDGDFDPDIWHEVTKPPYRSVRLINGKKQHVLNSLWRRRSTNGKWEYKQDDPSEEDLEWLSLSQNW